MSTTTKKSKTDQKQGKQGQNSELGMVLGRMVSFNTSLKMFHWHVTGPGSYAKHIALDQAIETLLDVTDRLVETSFSIVGDISITVPETQVPEDIVSHVADFYNEVEDSRDYFEETFSDSVIDDYQEGIQQLLYRLRRLQ